MSCALSPSFSSRRPRSKSRPVGLDDDHAHALRARLRIGLAREHDDVAELPVRDIGLLPVDHVVVAVAQRSRPHRLQVAAAAGLGQPDGADDLAADHLRQPLGFLLLAAETQDVCRHHVRVHGELRTRGAGPAQLLRDHHVVEKVRAGTAVFGGHVRAEQTRLARLVPKLARHDAGLLPLPVKGRDLGRDEAARRLAEHLVLVAEQGPGNHGWAGSSAGESGTGTIIVRYRTAPAQCGGPLRRCARSPG